jgi:hypothetical protein
MRIRNTSVAAIAIVAMAATACSGSNESEFPALSSEQPTAPAATAPAATAPAAAEPVSQPVSQLSGVEADIEQAYIDWVTFRTEALAAGSFNPKGLDEVAIGFAAEGLRAVMGYVEGGNVALVNVEVISIDINPAGSGAEVLGCSASTVESPDIADRVERPYVENAATLRLTDTGWKVSEQPADSAVGSSAQTRCVSKAASGEGMDWWNLTTTLYHESLAAGDPAAFYAVVSGNLMEENAPLFDAIVEAGKSLDAAPQFTVIAEELLDAAAGADDQHLRIKQCIEITNTVTVLDADGNPEPPLYEAGDRVPMVGDMQRLTAPEMQGLPFVTENGWVVGLRNQAVPQSENDLCATLP